MLLSALCTSNFCSCIIFNLMSTLPKLLQVSSNQINVEMIIFKIIPWTCVAEYAPPQWFLIEHCILPLSKFLVSRQLHFLSWGFFPPKMASNFLPKIVFNKPQYWCQTNCMFSINFKQNKQYRMFFLFFRDLLPWSLMFSMCSYDTVILLVIQIILSRLFCLLLLELSRLFLWAFYWELIVSVSIELNCFSPGNSGSRR